MIFLKRLVKPSGYHSKVDLDATLHDHEDETGTYFATQATFAVGVTFVIVAVFKQNYVSNNEQTQEQT